MCYTLPKFKEKVLWFWCGFWRILCIGTGWHYELGNNLWELFIFTPLLLLFPIIYSIVNYIKPKCHEIERKHLWQDFSVWTPVFQSDNSSSWRLSFELWMLSSLPGQLLVPAITNISRHCQTLGANIPLSQEHSSSKSLPNLEVMNRSSRGSARFLWVSSCDPGQVSLAPFLAAWGYCSSYLQEW